MTRITRRDFIQQSAGAAFAAAGLGGAESAVAAEPMPVYYYDGLNPKILVEEAQKVIHPMSASTWLEWLKFNGFIFPAGDPSTTLTNLNSFISPVKNLDKKFKTFFRIQIGSVVPLSAGAPRSLTLWGPGVTNCVKTWADAIKGSNIMGLCLDTEGDAWRIKENQLCRKPIGVLNVPTDGTWHKQWGYEVGKEFFSRMPDGELLIMHAAQWDDHTPDPVTYQVDKINCPQVMVTEYATTRWGQWPYFFSGVLEALYDQIASFVTQKKPEPGGKVILLSEETYGPSVGQVPDSGATIFENHLRDLLTGIKNHPAFTVASKGVSFNKAASLWKINSRTLVALGLWPLGKNVTPKDPNNVTFEEAWLGKTENTPPAKFFGKCVNAVSKLTGLEKRPFLWIYGQESAWMPPIPSNILDWQKSKKNQYPNYRNDGLGIGSNQNATPPVSSTNMPMAKKADDLSAYVSELQANRVR